MTHRRNLKITQIHHLKGPATAVLSCIIQREETPPCISLTCIAQQAPPKAPGTSQVLVVHLRERIFLSRIAVFEVPKGSTDSWQQPETSRLKPGNNGFSERFGKRPSFLDVRSKLMHGGDSTLGSRRFQIIHNSLMRSVDHVR